MPSYSGKIRRAARALFSANGRKRNRKSSWVGSFISRIFRRGTSRHADPDIGKYPYANYYPYADFLLELTSDTHTDSGLHVNSDLNADSATNASQRSDVQDPDPIIYDIRPRWSPPPLNDFSRVIRGYFRKRPGCDWSLTYAVSDACASPSPKNTLRIPAGSSDRWKQAACKDAWPLNFDDEFTWAEFNGIRSRKRHSNDTELDLFAHLNGITFVRRDLTITILRETAFPSESTDLA